MNTTPQKTNDKGLKKRLWTFILYPESAPEDWQERLQLSGLVSAVSPLHDQDINPTGEKKKPHYHIILAYSGPTTYNAVCKLTASYNATIPKPLESPKGMYRYFTHKDNPEKAQYSDENILHINGFDLGDFCDLSRSEILEKKIEIMELIRQVDIKEYSDLLTFLLDNGMRTEFDIASSNTFLFDKFITSRRHAELEQHLQYISSPKA